MHLNETQKQNTEHRWRNKQKQQQEVWWFMLESHPHLDQGYQSPNIRTQSSDENPHVTRNSTTKSEDQTVVNTAESQTCRLVTTSDLESRQHVPGSMVSPEEDPLAPQESRDSEQIQKAHQQEQPGNQAHPWSTEWHPPKPHIVFTWVVFV